MSKTAGDIQPLSQRITRGTTPKVGPTTCDAMEGSDSNSKIEHTLEAIMAKLAKLDDRDLATEITET